MLLQDLVVCLFCLFIWMFTCFSISDLARSLEVPVSHTQMAVLVPPVITSFGFGQMAQRIWPHSDRHSYTTKAWNKFKDLDCAEVRKRRLRIFLTFSLIKFVCVSTLCNQNYSKGVFILNLLNFLCNSLQKDCIRDFYDGCCPGRKVHFYSNTSRGKYCLW